MNYAYWSTTFRQYDRTPKFSIAQQTAHSTIRDAELQNGERVLISASEDVVCTVDTATSLIVPRRAHNRRACSLNYPYFPQGSYPTASTVICPISD